MYEGIYRGGWNESVGDSKNTYHITGGRGGVICIRVQGGVNESLYDS